MKVFYVFLLVLVYGVVRSHGRTHEFVAPTSLRKSYDEFFLAQQWPASFCSVNPNPCPSILPYFTVHGLWARLNGGSVKCKGKHFNPSKLNHNLKSDLTTYWPDLIKGEHQKFWGSEYDKHASCISPFQKDQDKYFSSTLELAKKLNVTTMLFEAGIHRGKSYSISQIKSAIHEAIKVIPTLQCNEDNDGTFHLVQIYLCIDNTASKVQHCQKEVQDKGCPCPTENNGNGKISFP